MHIAFHKRKALADNPKTRRLQFMLTRYVKPKCIICNELAHYKQPRRAWCNDHLPNKFRKMLSLEAQMARIVSYAEHIDESRR